MIWSIESIRSRSYIRCANRKWLNFEKLKKAKFAFSCLVSEKRKNSLYTFCLRTTSSNRYYRHIQVLFVYCVPIIAAGARNFFFGENSQSIKLWTSCSSLRLLLSIIRTCVYPRVL